MTASDREIAFADAEDVDVAVPVSPATLLDIMRNYPLSWERAGNGLYMGSSGKLIGLAAERGNVYQNYADHPEVTARWPALYIERPGKLVTARFGEAVQDRPKSAIVALAAFSAGPMLVSRGGILDIPSRIGAGGYEGFDSTTRKPQRAIGITVSGEVADGVWQSATLYEVAEDLIEAGCVEAMKLDGGGSSGVAEQNEDGMPVVAWGYDDRLLAAAIVLRKVKRWWRPREDELPKVDLDLDFTKLLTPNFRMSEFACKCCGAVSVSSKMAELVARLQALRERVDRPVNVTSGYRCARHDAEVGTSSSPGQGPHTTGMAADVWWDGVSVDEMAEAARAAGFTGIGRYHLGGFVHLDLRQPAATFEGDEAEAT